MRDAQPDDHDDELIRFEAEGAAPLPAPAEEGYVERDGARLWYAAYGSGPPVLLLHGGLGHSGNWGYQLPALLGAGYRVLLMDSRGHGRSTRDEQPFGYGRMALDVLAVLDAVGIDRLPIVGWSDGACTALILAMTAPERVAGVFFFVCNMDPGGAKEFSFTPIVERCFNRHVKDYARLSATPDQFQPFADAVGEMMAREPDCSAEELAAIRVPVTIVHSEHDEFIELDHARYLARTIPDADFVLLENVSHFAPLQRPALFNGALLAFLDRLHASRSAADGVAPDR